jgi:hypothetical protein
VLAGSGSGAIASLIGSFTPLAVLAGSGSGMIAILTSSTTTPTTGTRTSGTAAPLLGAGPASTYPGWSLVTDAYSDDGSTAFAGWQFAITINNVTYSGCFASANNYITFGSSSDVFQSLSQSSPSLPKIHLASMDGSYQRVYTQSAAAFSRVRIEGSQDRDTSAPEAGFSDRITEVTFWKPGASTQLIEVRTGDFSGVSQPFMIANASTSYASATTLGSNQSWVFEGNLTGTSWTLYADSYVTI